MGRRKEFIGTVISNRMQKTIIVRVERLARHPRYNRIVRFTTKFKVHDEGNTAQVGDVVRIQETRPLSKEKFFRLVGIVKKAEQVEQKLKDEVALEEVMGKAKKEKSGTGVATPEVQTEAKEG